MPRMNTFGLRVRTGGEVFLQTARELARELDRESTLELDLAVEVPCSCCKILPYCLDTCILVVLFMKGCLQVHVLLVSIIKFLFVRFA